MHRILSKRLVPFKRQFDLACPRLPKHVAFQSWKSSSNYDGIRCFSDRLDSSLVPENPNGQKKEDRPKDNSFLVSDYGIPNPSSLLSQPTRLDTSKGLQEQIVHIESPTLSAYNAMDGELPRTHSSLLPTKPQIESSSSSSSSSSSNSTSSFLRPQKVLGTTNIEGDDGYDDEFSSKGTKASDGHFLYRHHLNGIYRLKYGLSLLNSFELHELRDETSNIFWRTSTFLCPITGNKINSGMLPGAPKDSYQVRNGQYFYKKKKWAMQAAAMMALQSIESLKKDDAVELRTTMIQKELDALYRQQYQTTIHDDMLLTRKTDLGGPEGTWWTATFLCPITGQQYEAGTLRHHGEVRCDNDKICWYRDKSDAIAAVASRAIDVLRFQQTGVGEPRYCVEDPAIFAAPSNDLARQAIYVWYIQNHGVSLLRDSFVATTTILKGKDGGGNWWTASFICPVSGTRYDAGTIQQFDGAVLRDSDHVLWYRKKGDAIAAAASRALDAIRFRESQIVEPRYCVELPVGKERYDSSAESIASSTVADAPDQSLEQGDVTASVGEESSSVGEESSTDEDDYIIQHVSTFQGPMTTFQDGPQAGLNLITKIWIESSETSGKANREHHFLSNPISDRKRTIKSVLDWVALQKSDQENQNSERVEFDNQQQKASVKVANMMLQSLARANHRLPFESKACGVEEAATKMLELMLSSKNMKPDADTYAAYLLCLEGANPFLVAKRGQAIYNAMRSGSKYGGHKLPQPTIAAFNSLLQLWAQTGRKNEIFKLSVSSVLPPNRETFLSLLSCLAYPAEANDFDSNYALECIQQMQSIYDNSGDETYLPDTEVYNAPLRWSGGLVTSSTRPFARCIPWDNYDVIFREGFRLCSEEDSLFQQALAMEEWLQDMDSEKTGSMVRPSIETYEAVIQAWVRTGSEEGVRRAEALIEQAFEKLRERSEKLRAQTFHPILAAWSFSGTRAGAEKVVHWLDRMSAHVGKGEVDSRLQVTPIIAHVTLQRRLLDSIKDLECDQVEARNKIRSDILESARSATKHLRMLMDDLIVHNDGVLLDAGAFSLTIRSWYNVALANCKEDSLEQVDLAVEEIFRIAQDLELFVSQTKEKSRISERSAPRRQLDHLVEHTPEVFSGILFDLREIDVYTQGSTHDNVTSRSYFQRFVEKFEKIVRVCEELQLLRNDLRSPAIWENSSLSKPNNELFPDDTIIYEDLFSIPYKGLLNHKLQPLETTDLYKFILKSLNESINIPTSDYSGILRLSFLVLNSIQSHKLGHPVTVASAHKFAASLINKLDLKATERDELLKRIVLSFDATEWEGVSKSIRAEIYGIRRLLKSSISNPKLEAHAPSVGSQAVKRKRTRIRETQYTPAPRNLARNTSIRRKEMQ